MKSVVCAVMALSLVVSIPAVAKGRGQKQWSDPAQAKKADPVVLQDLSITGKIAKTQKQDNKGRTTDSYVLTDATGQDFKLPTPHAAKARKGEAFAPPINLDDYVGKTVTVVAKGTESVKKNGSKTTHIVQIVSVSAVPDAAPAAANPAPAASPAPAPDAAPAAVASPK